MKLPDDKKERTKILLLIAIGAVAVLYGIFSGIMMGQKSMNERVAKIEQLQEKLRKSELTVKRLNSDLLSSSNSLSELHDIANVRGWVLKDRLGNFLLGATEVVEEQAKAAGALIGPIKEGGISQIPQGDNPVATNTFHIYTANVQMEGGVHALLRLLRGLESNNPYLCVSAVSITAQRGKPEKHAITFDVQWPIWADPKGPSKLEEQVEALKRNTPSQQPPASDKTPTTETKES
jgi:hypothetical protein